MSDTFDVIMAAYRSTDPAERALGGSLAKSVAAMDKNGVRGLKAALAEAAGKFSPDRTVLPIPDRTFGGTMGRTIDQSVADWTMIPGPQAPEDAPNVLIVLIDDAGFGSPPTPARSRAPSLIQDTNSAGAPNGAHGRVGKEAGL